MRLWTSKFIAGLGFLVLFILNARLRPLNETTGERPAVIPGTEHTVFSFVFLLVLLFTISHLGSWVMWKLRHRGESGHQEGSKAGRKKKPGGA